MENRKTQYAKDTNIYILFQPLTRAGRGGRILERQKSEDKSEINEIITGLTFEQNAPEFNEWHPTLMNDTQIFISSIE